MTNVKLNNLVSFLITANQALKKLGINETFLQHMQCSISEFFTIAEEFSIDDINHAINCLESNRLDESNFIMSMESGFNNYSYRLKKREL